MEKKTCCMVSCDKVETDVTGVERREFYPFPKDFNLCMLWVQNSGRPEYFEDFAFAGAQPFLNRHICSDHFVDNDFVNPNDRISGLRPEAVPNLNLIFPKVEIKEEHIDSEFVEVITGSLISNPDLINEIKLEKFENDNCDEVNANFSFSSNDDSCNDLLGMPLPKGVEVYKETEQDKELSNEFFRKYENAVRRNNRRSAETEEERAIRLQREALRAKIRRSQESEEQKRMRRMKNALRAAFRRKNETPQQRALRKRKDMLRAQMRRKAETEAEARIRKYNDAVRAAFRRNNETEQQRMERKMKDIMRAAKRRSMETPEQREERLRRDRERASKRRMLKKIAEQMARLGAVPDFSQVNEAPVKREPTENGVQQPITPSLESVVAQCNDSSTLERLQQVLDIIEGKTDRRRRRRRLNMAEINESLPNYPELLASLGIIPGKTEQSDEKPPEFSQFSANPDAVSPLADCVDSKVGILDRNNDRLRSLGLVGNSKDTNCINDSEEGVDSPDCLKTDDFTSGNVSEQTYQDEAAGSVDNPLAVNSNEIVFEMGSGRGVDLLKMDGAQERNASRQAYQLTDVSDSHGSSAVGYDNSENECQERASVLEQEVVWA